jgi:dipeptidyl aminopeptidase/acylaminoacyl peptidase
MHEILVTSSIDGSREPNLLWVPEGRGPFPLLVGLHTWSFDRTNQVKEMLPRCQARNWALLLPEARGTNLDSNPRAAQAAGCPLARQDIYDAIDHVLATQAIDPRQVLALGGSGGGHLALQLAGTAPERFAAVSAWVPITNLALWHGENPNYTKHIAACCGGAPGASAAVDAAYRERSPISRIAVIARAVLSVHHGRHDPSVPWHHTEDLAQAISAHQPKHFYHEIFDGGHELQYDRAFAWLERRLAAVAGGPALSG